MLTKAQRATLQTAIEASAPLKAPAKTTAGAATLSDLLNADASPVVIVWRERMTAQEVYAALDIAELLVLPNAAVVFAVLQVMLAEGWIDPRSAKIRADFLALFPVGNTRTNLVAAAKRNATVLEAVFATGAGTSGNPAVLVVSGKIAGSELEEVRG